MSNDFVMCGVPCSVAVVLTISVDGEQVVTGVHTAELLRIRRQRERQMPNAHACCRLAAFAGHMFQSRCIYTMCLPGPDASP